MKKISLLVCFLSLLVSFSHSQECRSCGAEKCNPCDSDKVDTTPKKRRLNLFYSSDDNYKNPLAEPLDPREDYEWPGMNESTFYDNLTR